MAIKIKCDLPCYTDLLKQCVIAQMSGDCKYCLFEKLLHGECTGIETFCEVETDQI